VVKPGRLSRLINDLFELSKMEEGKINLYQEWVNLEEILETILPQAELLAKKKGLQLRVHLQENLPPIYVDGLRLEQIMMNLIDNAIRYTDHGWVGIRIEQARSGDLMIIIEDSGKGIPEDELPFIFDRFYRVEKSRSREFGGTGLGLAIVKQLVVMQGGTVDVCSEVGTGTRFEIRFPTNKAGNRQVNKRKK
jgi:signal transduction histidine kinase